MSIQPGTLFIVATPIGNLGDMSPRAVEVLGAVHRVAAEDTRHSRPLLAHFGIATPMLAYHEHNEAEQSVRLLELLQAGHDIALISDAGTPLINDPGFRLVRAAREAGIAVVPVPGPSALVAALSVAGLPVDRFVFEGFLPAKQAARRRRLAELVGEPRTLVFYESTHRIVDSIADLAEVFGGVREAAIARELTKRFETVRAGSLGELQQWLGGDPDQRRGEFVILVRGAPQTAGSESLDVDRLLRELLAELGVKRAAAVAGRVTGLPKKQLYQRALALRGSESE